MKIGKIIGLGALATLIPYRFTKNKETGTMEVRSLLLGVRVTPVDGKLRYAISIPGPGLGPDEEAPEAPAEEPAVEAAAPEAAPEQA